MPISFSPPPLPATSTSASAGQRLEKTLKIVEKYSQYYNKSKKYLPKGAKSVGDNEKQISLQKSAVLLQFIGAKKSRSNKKKKKSSCKKHHKGTALQALLPKEGVGYTQRGKLSKAKDKESKNSRVGAKQRREIKSIILGRGSRVLRKFCSRFYRS